MQSSESMGRRAAAQSAQSEGSSSSELDDQLEKDRYLSGVRPELEKDRYLSEVRSTITLFDSKG